MERFVQFFLRAAGCIELHMIHTPNWIMWGRYEKSVG